MPRVDPRGHGEAGMTGMTSMTSRGRSPRARGSPEPLGMVALLHRSIPAGTGKPLRSGSRCIRCKVDPRGHGEADPTITTPTANGGRSPRARGSRGFPSEIVGAAGSIPAGTGKPSPQWYVREIWGVDPRGHGEALFRQHGTAPLLGSIPAGTGKPTRSRLLRLVVQVDPRGHGEAVGWRGARDAEAGRSPRARGSPQRVGHKHRPEGSIPAGTGKPPHR